MPLYNYRAYVGAAIDSILAQTRPAEEIIVVDDGSTDGVGEILDRYIGRLRAIRQENRGPSAAVNRGLAETTGDAVAFLDSDDLWARDKLERQCAVLATDASIDGVFGHIKQFTGNDPFPTGIDRGCALQHPQPGVSRNTLLVRRYVFDRFGLFDESLRATDFVPWYARAVALGFQATILPEVLAYRRLHSANTGVVRRSEQQQENLLGLKRALEIRRQRARSIKPGS
jgi:glycosyltransferase involved in cell wall biosynthesis